MEKNSLVFHICDCGQCGKLYLSFSVLLVQKQHNSEKKTFFASSHTAPFFGAIERSIFYEQIRVFVFCNLPKASLPTATLFVHRVHSVLIGVVLFATLRAVIFSQAIRLF
jgi:hypothetical protein